MEGPLHSGEAPGSSSSPEEQNGSQGYGREGETGGRGPDAPAPQTSMRLIGSKRGQLTVDMRLSCDLLSEKGAN
jgi:hypothetical protein